MRQYLDLLKDVLENGEVRDDRTGTGTRSVFGRQLRFDLRQGFPAVTTKKLQFHSVVVELLWFLRGDTNTKFLHDHGVHIWDEWADERGDLGPIYGAQWRRWSNPIFGPADQLRNVVEQIEKTPTSRRIVMSAWNVNALEDMALLPCHVLSQFYVSHGNRLCCQVYQRSADLFLGLPFNIASYATLTHMLAAVSGLEVGDLVFTLGDAHIYLNHEDAVRTQLAREPLPLPKLQLTLLPDMTPQFAPAERLTDFILAHRVLALETWSPERIALIDYKHHPAIRAPISV